MVYRTETLIQNLNAAVRRTRLEREMQVLPNMAERFDNVDIFDGTLSRARRLLNPRESHTYIQTRALDVESSVQPDLKQPSEGNQTLSLYQDVMRGLSLFNGMLPQIPFLNR